MNPQFESMQHAEPSVVLVVDAPNFEYAFRTDALTIAFAFASFQIDNREDDAGLLFASRQRSAHVRSSRWPQRAA